MRDREEGGCSSEGDGKLKEGSDLCGSASHLSL